MKKAIKAIVGIALALSFAVVPSAIKSTDSANSSSIATVSAAVIHEENINLHGLRIVGRTGYTYRLTKVRVTDNAGTQYYGPACGWRSYNWFSYIY